jgi:hypothetical protein
MVRGKDKISVRDNMRQLRGNNRDAFDVVIVQDWGLGWWRSPSQPSDWIFGSSAHAAPWQVPVADAGEEVQRRIERNPCVIRDQNLGPSVPLKGLPSIITAVEEESDHTPARNAVRPAECDKEV